ncbi:MAG: alpha/beta hydrolase [Anaerolineales bacterium]|nr:alpha/beta hydrolase [Anaerolineales bacterium]
MTTIPFYDFGGSGPLLHFAGPNAYTPETFRQFIEPFLPHYHVVAIYHRPLWPHSSPNELETDWHIIADDLIRFLEQEQMRPAVALGHSLGAVSTTYAAVERPDLFQQLVLVDPVFLPASILQMAAANPEAVRAHMPMVDRALRRKNRWPTRQAAFERFREKRVFARWSDEALWDYVNFSVTENGTTGEVGLRWPREWEAAFYANPPQKVWEAIAQVRQPTLAVRGTESDTLFPEAWTYWQQLQPDATFVELPDVGHMMMMERPLLVADTILNHLGKPRNAESADKR